MKNTSQVRTILINVVVGFAFYLLQESLFSGAVSTKENGLSSYIKCERQERHSLLSLFTVGAMILGGT